MEIDLTSEAERNLIPKRYGSFKKCRWNDLPRSEYAVLSYQWKTKWGPIAKFIFGDSGSPNPLKFKYSWLDLACLNQLDGDRMATIGRSDEIYLHAKEYHLMEVGSLSRG